MTCLPRAFPFGFQQTLLYYVSPTDQIQVELASRNFKPADGEGYLGYFGYDRYQDPEYTLQATPAILGASVIRGPKFRCPYKFAWNLQHLTILQYQALWGMYKRQQIEKLPVRLFDTRLALDEAGVRDRAKCSTFPIPGAPTVSGINYFYPQFNIWLDFGTERESYQYAQFGLKFTATELDPANPVPVSQDV